MEREREGGREGEREREREKGRTVGALKALRAMGGQSKGCRV